MMARDRASAMLGMVVERSDFGHAIVSMALRDDMMNGHDVTHGGFVFALADTAFAYVCNGRNLRSVAAQASITFLDQAREGEVLIAEAREQALVGRSGVTHVSVRAEDGRAIAEFTGFSRSLGGELIGDQE